MTEAYHITDVSCVSSKMGQRKDIRSKFATIFLYADPRLQLAASEAKKKVVSVRTLNSRIEMGVSNSSTKTPTFVEHRLAVRRRTSYAAAKCNAKLSSVCRGEEGCGPIVCTTW